MNNLYPEYINSVQWNKDGLVPAIAQDFKTNEILMMAWMNKESLQITVEKGYATYWSRSRDKLWLKGETSGNLQLVKNIQLDCDADTIVLKIDQLGDGNACHTGRRSCFFLTLEQIEKQPNWKENTDSNNECDINKHE